MTEGWTIWILDRVDARPDLIIIKTSLEAVSNYGSCHRTTFLSLPTPPPGHGGVGLSLGQIHAYPRDAFAVGTLTEHRRKPSPPEKGHGA